jgi:hypothetical protein
MAGSALGALKTAATRIGLTPEEYQERISRGEKWCGGCREWHYQDAFGTDRSRSDGRTRVCRTSRSMRQRETYIPRPATPRKSSYPAGGDPARARYRVNHLVTTGRIPHPNTLPCVDCGHRWELGARRHEYDHHMGYSIEHHLSVEAVCTLCHHRRGRERGTHIRKRGPNGRFVR